MGGGDAARAARFAWLFANPGIGREEISNCVTDRFCRRARCSVDSEGGEREVGCYVCWGSISSEPSRSVLLTGNRTLERVNPWGDMRVLVSTSRLTPYGSTGAKLCVLTMR